MRPAAARARSKTIAAWLALLGGPLGAHRFYLHGSGDRLAWLHPWPTLVGLVGLGRALEFGQDDRLAWALMPLLGLMIAATSLQAILYGLTPDERWHQRFDPGRPLRPSGWPAVIAVVLALMVGATSLLATIAFVQQRLAELGF